MRRTLIAVLVAALPAYAEEDRWLEYGGSAVAELLHATQPRNWPARVDLSASIEADLGALTGWATLDHWYVFALPTLAWGEEEDWRWRARLYQAWVKWDGSDRLNILAGYYDPTWDFHSLPSSAPFVRLPSRVGGEFSPGSPGLLDLYPLAAPAVRIEFKPRKNLAIQTAALALDSDYELHGRAVPADGALLLAEIAWRTAEDEEETAGHFHAGLGGWLLTADVSWGLYAFADKTLWHEQGDNDQGCSAFASAAVANADRRFAGGLNWRGLFPHRDDDVTAAAIIHESRESRTAWELLHRVPLAAECWLQFTVQQQRAGDWRIGFTLGCEF